MMVTMKVAMAADAVALGEKVLLCSTQKLLTRFFSFALIVKAFKQIKKDYFVLIFSGWTL